MSLYRSLVINYLNTKASDAFSKSSTSFFKRIKIVLLSFAVGYGSWYEHVKGWEELQLDKEHPVLFVSYEDLHRVST